MPEHSYGRGYAWALVGTFTALSVILNGAHAVLGMSGRSGVEQILAALVAIVAPVSLLLATELVVKLIRDWSRRRRWLTALRAVCAGTTAAIAAVAFATSFVALMDMARRMGVSDELAWALPAVVDAMIIIATLAVVVAEAEMTLDRAVVVEVATSPVELPVEFVVGAPVGVAATSGDELGGETAASVADNADPVDDRSAAQSLSAFTEQRGSAIGVRSLHSDEPVEYAVAQSANVAVAQGDESFDVRSLHSERPAEHAEDSANVEASGVRLVDEQPAAQPVATFDEGDDARSVADAYAFTEQRGSAIGVRSLHSDEPVEHAVAQSANVAVAQGDESFDDGSAADGDEWLTFAERVRDAANSKADPATVARVLELTEAGGTRRDVGVAVGMSASTVSNLVKVAQDLGDRRPRLTAVR